jgi:hypothetical protein
MSRIRNLTLGEKKATQAWQSVAQFSLEVLQSLMESLPWASIDALMSRMRKTRSEKNSFSGSTDCRVIFFGSPAEPDWRGLSIYWWAYDQNQKDSTDRRKLATEFDRLQSNFVWKSSRAWLERSWHPLMRLWPEQERLYRSEKISYWVPQTVEEFCLEVLQNLIGELLTRIRNTL